MKQVTIIFCLIANAICAQAPQGISYQSVIRNASNQIIANQPIGLRISILQGTETGTSIYQETHQTGSNINGLISIILGQGNNVIGQFSNIDWSLGPYFIKSESDPTGGSDFTIVGTSMLQSVPYALYAASSGSSIPGPQGNQGPAGAQGAQGDAGDAGIAGQVGPVGPAGSGACDIIGKGNLHAAYTSTNAYGFSQSQGSSATNYNTATWVAQSLDSAPLGSASSESQIVIYTAGNAYGFAQSQSSLGSPPNFNSGTWVSVALSGTPIGAVATAQSVIIYTTTNAYAFSQSQSTLGDPPNLNAGQWTNTSISGSILQASASSRMAVILTDTNVYGFSQSQGSLGSAPNDSYGVWTAQSISGNAIDIKTTR
jgi:hypothetical protein